MKIIVLGAGQVGTSTAEILSGENHDITLVDVNSNILQPIQDRLDIRTVSGHASHPSTLQAAGAEDADMVLAVTDTDEVNMLACQICHSLFRTPTKIARIRSSDYVTYRELFSNDAVPIDHIISPEDVLTTHILRLIEHPGALQVLDFAGGKIQLVGIRADQNSPIVGHEIRELRDHLPNVDSRVAAIYRGNQSVQPTGNTVIQPEDEVFFVAAKPHIQQVINELHEQTTTNRRIMLAGAGNIGFRLAKTLARRKYTVKLLERSMARAQQVSEQLDNVVVLHGDAADEDMLLQENIQSVDVFVALTNDDEANILSSMLAKRLGADLVIALVNRPAYGDLIEDTGVDIAVSPRRATVGSLLTHIRRGDIVAVHSLRNGAAEAIEAIAHGDPTTSDVVGKMIGELDLPESAKVGAILRNEDVYIAHDDTYIEPEDHLILFVTDKKYLPDVEKLFQVSATFV